MNKRTVFLVVICCLLVCIGCIYLCFKPIIIHKPYVEYEFLHDNLYDHIDTIVLDAPFYDSSYIYIDTIHLYNPIDTVDFTQGENKIIIYTNGADISFLPEKIKKWTLLECRNNKTIEEVKKNFVFKWIRGQFAETTDFDSRIFFFKNNKLVFSGKFMIEESISLRFKNTGWTFATNYNELIRCFSEFKRVYFPIIKMN
jgi:hypothetical protein